MTTPDLVVLVLDQRGLTRKQAERAARDKARREEMDEVPARILERKEREQEKGL
jgi:hypothetical protein